MGTWHERDAYTKCKRRKRGGKASGSNPRVGHEVTSEGSRKGGSNKPFKVPRREEAGKRGNRNFRGSTSGQNRNAKPGDMNEKVKGNGNSFAASKLHKQKKFDRKRQKK